ncbi:MDR family MFS transporter [Timonella sp. A28]|uniref:MDR family MFS transporter n=1 Tax=Timonella sp. A28 TaxID=3442640 RepID=UPI003EBF92F2
MTREHNSIKLLFAGLMVTQFMSSLGQTVLSSALPTIVGELNGVEHMAWVITAFILAATIVMPIYGKLSDLWGRKPLLLVAIVLFLAGSVLGALASSMNALVIARAIQGAGGGGLMILSQAAIADVVPARERGKYMGIMGATFAVSSVAGPLLGGWFTEGPGWRWAFWMNIPLAALSICATLLFLHTPRVVNVVKPKIDVLGMALLSVVTTAFVLLVTLGGSAYAWSEPFITVLAAVTLLSGVAFVFAEKRAAEPIMPLFLFRDRNFNLTTITALATGIVMFGAIGYIPTYLQMAGGFSAATAGLLMAPMMLSLLISSTVTGLAVSRSGKYRMFPVVGSLVVAVGLLWMAQTELDTPVVVICLAMSVMGVGVGMSLQILTLIVQSSFSLKVVGTATAATNYFRQVGSTLGSAVVGAVFASRLMFYVEDRMGEDAAVVGDASSFTPAFVHSLPQSVREPILAAYNDALIPIYLWLIPLVLIAAVSAFFVKERPLATSIEEAMGDSPLRAPHSRIEDDSTT